MARESSFASSLCCCYLQFVNEIPLAFSHTLQVGFCRLKGTCIAPMITCWEYEAQRGFPTPFGSSASNNGIIVIAPCRDVI